MEVQKALGELSTLTRNYPGLYQRVELVVKPNLADKIFSAINFFSNRRLTRLRQALTMLDTRAKEAFQTIDKILSISYSIEKSLTLENEQAIGRILRLSTDLEFKQHQTKAMRNQCQKTLQLIRKYDLLKLPENYLDWTKISFDVVVPPQGMTINERTYHQRTWANLIALINEEKKLMLEIKSTNERYEWTSKYESICKNASQKFESERYLLSEKLDRLRNAITVGELQEIERFLNGKSKRGMPFEDLVVENTDPSKSLGNYKIEVDISNNSRQYSNPK